MKIGQPETLRAIHAFPGADMQKVVPEFEGVKQRGSSVRHLRNVR